MVDDWSDSHTVLAYPERGLDGPQVVMLGGDFAGTYEAHGMPMARPTSHTSNLTTEAS